MELERRLASIEDITSPEILRLQSITYELHQANKRLTVLLDPGDAGYSFVRPSRQTESENNALRDISSDLIRLWDGPLLGRALHPNLS